MRKLILFTLLALAVLIGWTFEVSQRHSPLIINTSMNREWRLRELKVLVWNIYKAREDKFFTHFRGLVQEQDLLLLQEGLLSKNFTEELGYHRSHQWGFAESFLYRSSNEATGVISGSRVSPARQVLLRSTAREPIVGTPKSMLLQYYNVKGLKHQLLVINVHLINFSLLSTFEEQLQQLAPYLDTHQGPILLAGDFNTWSQERWRALLGFTELFNLKQVLFSKDERATFMGRKVDYSFTRGLEVVRALSLKLDGASDHSPLFITIRLILDAQD